MIEPLLPHHEAGSKEGSPVGSNPTMSSSTAKGGAKNHDGALKDLARRTGRCPQKRCDPHQARFMKIRIADARRRGCSAV